MERTYYLIDDGSLDTVIRANCPCGHSWTERISHETASPFRDADGTLPESEFRQLCREYLDDTLCTNCEE